MIIDCVASVRADHARTVGRLTGQAEPRDS